MYIKNYLYLALSMFAVFAGCGGADDSSSSSAPSGTSSSSAGGSCNYPDLVSASERTQANACGIHVSAAYAEADSGLASVIAACQKGQKATADAYYASTYKSMVSFARSNSATLSCGTNTAPTVANTSSQTYYNLCVKTTPSGGTITYSSACYGPVQSGEGGCGGGGYSYFTQNISLSACQAAGASWLKSR